MTSLQNFGFDLPETCQKTLRLNNEYDLKSRRSRTQVIIL